MTVVKTETILLPGVPEPEAIVEPEIEEGAVYETGGRSRRNNRGRGTGDSADAIELKKQLKVPVEIMAHNRTRF